MTAAACATKPAAARPSGLTALDLDEIEELARANESETYRGALLALVEEVRRLRGERSESRTGEACGA